MMLKLPIRRNAAEHPHVIIPFNNAPFVHTVRAENDGGVGGDVEGLNGHAAHDEGEAKAREGGEAGVFGFDVAVSHY